MPTIHVSCPSCGAPLAQNINELVLTALADAEHGLWLAGERRTAAFNAYESARNALAGARVVAIARQVVKARPGSSERGIAVSALIDELRAYDRETRPLPEDVKMRRAGAAQLPGFSD